MIEFRELKGDLIQLSKQGLFDVIAHGCNCFSKQKSGLAKQMVENFQTDRFEMEVSKKTTPIEKLGNIDYQYYWPSDALHFAVVNCYTQYEYGTDKVNADYEAITLCMRKLNKVFAGRKIGLPKIGCGLAGGDWSVVKNILTTELKDCDVTLVSL
jgi:O-acetyl-ADP-ribose deacetylase (regulator of RNase III)